MVFAFFGYIATITCLAKVLCNLSEYVLVCVVYTCLCVLAPTWLRVIIAQWLEHVSVCWSIGCKFDAWLSYFYNVFVSLSKNLPWSIQLHKRENGLPHHAISVVYLGIKLMPSCLVLFRGVDLSMSPVDSQFLSKERILFGKEQSLGT